MRKFRTGFTLVELLVVVVIIIILIAILVPAAQRAVAIATRTQCAANQHALGVAFAEYSLDSKQAVPNAFRWGVNRPNYPDGGHSFHADTNGELGIRSVQGDLENYPGGQVYPYARTDKMFLCPNYESMAAHPRMQNHFRGESSPTTVPYVVTIYGLWQHTEEEKEIGLAYSAHPSLQENWFGLTLLKFDGPFDAGSTSYPMRPADTLLLGEENLYGNEPWTPWERNDSRVAASRSRNPGSRVDGLGNFHAPSGEHPSGSSNVLFFDGHSEVSGGSESKDVIFPGMQTP